MDRHRPWAQPRRPETDRVTRYDDPIFRQGARAIARWYGLLADIADRKRAEEERDRLRELETDLAHLNRVSLMGELTASIAHEVNQPLLGIVSSASSCARGLATEPPNLPRAQRALERIMEAGTRASAVIDRVRTLVKREPVRVAPVDLNETVRDVIAMVRDEGQRLGVSLTAHLADELRVVAGDRVQLQRVVLNLILDAIEATRAVEGRSRQVWIATRREGGEGVHVEVRDLGVGLAPEAQARVFEAFYWTEPSGLGMGLSICRSIVEALAAGLGPSPTRRTGDPGVLASAGARGRGGDSFINSAWAMNVADVPKCLSRSAMRCRRLKSVS